MNFVLGALNLVWTLVLGLWSLVFGLCLSLPENKRALNANFQSTKLKARRPKTKVHRPKSSFIEQLQLPDPIASCPDRLQPGLRRLLPRRFRSIRHCAGPS